MEVYLFELNHEKMNNGWMSSRLFGRMHNFFDFRIADAIRDLSCGRKI